MLLRRLCLLWALGGMLSSFQGRAAASPFDIIINEICYNPWAGEDLDEFVELYNRGPTAIDLGGWRFTEGIALTIPAGVSLGPDQYLIVVPDADHSKLRYKLGNAIGGFTGRLDNNGEVLALADAAGAVISRLHYEDGGVWPSNPDGLGPTLELVTPHEQNDLPQHWASSLTLDGTPGRRNTRFMAARAAVAAVRPDDRFRTFKGIAEPSNPLTDWTARGFDAGAWAEAQGPFGYGGAYAVETVLGDMQNAYTTYYIRRAFDLDAATLADLQGGTLGLNLRARYDDGYIAYLNGVEVGRANAGTAGTPIPRDGVADSGINNGSAIVSLDAHAGSLLASGNVLAVQGLNRAAASGDFFLSVELLVSPRALSSDEAPRSVVVNEVRPAEGAGGNGFVELYNRTQAPINLGGYFIADSRGGLYAIPGGTAIAARGFLTVTEAQLGFPPALARAAYALLRPDGETWVDGLDPRPGPAGSSGISYGLIPDGGDDQHLLTAPTPGAPNTVALETGVVLNEILYHPTFVAPSGNCLRQCSDPDQWVELHNRGVAAVEVSGWSLTKGVEFTIPSTTSIPGGGYLVVAADRDRFLAKYPTVPPGRVVGGWTQSLGRDSDTINLRDALGNRVDHVHYGDGKPVNDEEPVDGQNDRTLLSSEWASEPDEGTGRSLELIHPALDNRAGAAWAPGPPLGTPGAANGSFDATAPPVVWDVENSPVVPRSGEAVRVTCRVSSVSPVAKVEALWHLEPAGAAVALALKDDGLSGDGAAGDGVHGGSIPPQADLSVVAFRVRAQAQDGQTALVPRSPAVPPYAGFQGPFYLYQVDGAVPPTNGSVTYRVVMAAADLSELRARSVQSNVLLPCTFIADGKAHHTLGIRIRGESTRASDRKPWRINFPPERRFRGLEHVNLVSNNLEREVIAADLFRRAGLPYMQEWTVNLVFQGQLDPLYALKENFDGDFLDRFFGGSSTGNLYRAIDPLPAGGQPQGDLTYYGEDPEDLLVYREVYDKRSNREEDDYADVIALCRAFDPVATPDGVFAETIDGLIDVHEWARFFAVQSLISNNDGGIQNSTGEDYLLYHVPQGSSRPDRGRWLLLPWDIDETYTNAAERLFRASIPGIRRFLTHPEFAPLYYAHLIDLRGGVFSRFETRQRFYLIDDLFGFGTIDGIDSYNTDRVGFIDENVPVVLSAGVTGAAGGGTLIAEGALWRYFKGTEEPSGGDLTWTGRTGFDDSGWLEGASGIGYGDGDDQTLIADMENGYTTLYARRTFPVADPAFVDALNLVIDYDDGFVCYLNGREVARRNAPGPADSFVPSGATASANREAGTAETIDLRAHRGLLVAGDNVLALQGLNGTIDSTDFSLIPALTTGGGGAAGGGCGTTLYATGSAVTLAGSSHAARTQRVELNGAAAAYNPFTARWAGEVSLVPGLNTVKVEAFDALGASIDTLEIAIHRLARPFTAVSGPLTGNTNWTAAGGPYLMTGDVTVPAGARLAIGPGTVVLGQSGASIIVRGHLEAVGTREASIVLRAFSCQNRMGGIAFDSTGTGAAAPEHHLRFCDFEFGDTPAGYEGMLAPVGSKLLVEDSSFREIFANAIDGTDARVEIRRSLFERVHEAVHCTRSVVVVLDSTFSTLIGDNDAIDFDVNVAGTERSRIERCLIENSSDDGIDLQLASVDIRDNIIRFVQDKAMSLEGNGPIGPPVVTGNLIHDSGTAMALKDGVTVNDAHHNTVVGNQEGVSLFPKATSQGGRGVFHSMIIWDNIFDVKLAGNSTVSIAFSDIGESWEGEGNIARDPRFMSQLRKDFSLAPGSPAIGAGKDGTDMGAIPFTSQEPVFTRGDADASGEVNLTDVIVGLEYLFRGRAGPACLDRLDPNDDGRVDIADPVFLLFYLYAQGSAPWPPFPGPGPDPTPDPLACKN